MIEFGLTLLILAAIVALMSVGVIMGRKPIKGSCGGIKALGMGANCDICGGNPQRCEEVSPTNTDRR